MALQPETLCSVFHGVAHRLGRCRPSGTATFVLQTCFAAHAHHTALNRRLRRPTSLQKPLGMQPLPPLAFTQGLKTLQNLEHDLIGWRVQLLSADMRIVGSVREVLHGTRNQAGRLKHPALNTLLRVCHVTVLEPYGFKGVEEHFIPLVPEILPWLDPKTCTIFMTPPEGVNGWNPRIWSQVKLVDLTEANLGPGTTTLKALRPMPSRKQLEEAGRRDLLELIQTSGGFLQVALRCGYRPLRRPNGYWDSLENLKLELDRFVAGSWVQLPHPDTGKPYYFNKVSGRVMLRKPLCRTTTLSGSSSSSSSDYNSFEVGDDASNFNAAGSMAPPQSGRRSPESVIPTQSMLIAAQRFDLHYAILRVGGYRAAAELLSRPSARPRCPGLKSRRGLQAELGAINRRLGRPAGSMPTEVQLRELGRCDIVNVIRTSGGFNRVGSMLQLQTKRRSRAYWHKVEHVVEEVKAYLRDQIASNKAMSQLPVLPVVEPTLTATASKQQQQQQPAVAQHLPTHAELMRCGRQDLLYGLARHGHAHVAQLCGLLQQKQGLAKGKLTLAAVHAAIQAGCTQPKTILQYLASQGIVIARTHLVTQLGKWVQRSILIKPKRGTYRIAAGEQTNDESKAA